MPAAFFHTFLLFFPWPMKIRYSLLLNDFFVYCQSPFTRMLTHEGKDSLWFVHCCLPNFEKIPSNLEDAQYSFVERTHRGKNLLFSVIQKAKGAYYKVRNSMQHDIIPKVCNYPARRLDKTSWEASHIDVSFLCKGSQNYYLKYISCWAVKVQIYKLGFFYFFLKKKNW